MSKWISVDDELPEVDFLVFISSNSSDYNYAKWNGELWIKNSQPLGYAPTHWMTIPEQTK